MKKPKETPKTGMDAPIKGYKGYDSNFKCRGFQYEVGKEYETEQTPVRCTENGFHFCENPLDVFGYYPPAQNKFSEVVGGGQVSRDDDSDTKVAVSKIKIGVELSIHAMIDAAIKFIFSKTTLSKGITNDKNNMQASNSGDSGAASNSGDSGAASNSGYRGAASNSGDSGAASNSGDRGAALSIGSYATAETSVPNSIACGLGYKNTAKGCAGSWIVLSEQAEVDNNIVIINVKAVIVDGVNIKANTFYKLENGNFIIA